jgi:signal peptidase I
MRIFWDNLRTIFYALLLAIAIQFFIARPYRIPSESMQPTLEVGDYILVTKWPYGYGPYSFSPLERLFPPGRLLARPPKRGDVIVFRSVPDPYRDYVKRLIGLPGERIQLRDSRLYINGEPVEREPLGLTPFAASNGQMVQVETWQETLPNGATYRTFERPGVAEESSAEYVVPEGHYFFMGDDRDNSEDSRVLKKMGFVPFENLVGPAQFVLVSFDSSANIFDPMTLVRGFRSARFLKGLS